MGFNSGFKGLKKRQKLLLGSGTKAAAYVALESTKSNEIIYNVTTYVEKTYL